MHPQRAASAPHRKAEVTPEANGGLHCQACSAVHMALGRSCCSGRHWLSDLLSSPCLHLEAASLIRCQHGRRCTGCSCAASWA